MKRMYLLLLTSALLLTGCSRRQSLAGISPENPPAETTAASQPEQQALPMREIRCFENVTIRIPDAPALLPPDSQGENGGLAFERCVRDLEGQPAEIVLHSIARDSFGTDHTGEVETKALPNANGIRLWKMICNSPELSVNRAPCTNIRYVAEYHHNYYVMNPTTKAENPQDKAPESILNAMEIDDSALHYVYNPNADQSDDTGLCYALLSPEDQKIYEEIYRTVNPANGLNHPTWTRTGCSEAELKRLTRIAEAVETEHFENWVFYYYEIKQENGTFSCGFTKEAPETDADSAKGWENAEKQSDMILAAMPEGLTRYGKYLYLAKALCAMTTYDHENAGCNPYTMRGAFEDGKSVCVGYAAAYSYLCKRAGLFCMCVSGESHVWNVIRLNNELYYMDVTWMDVQDCGYDYNSDYDQPFTSNDPLHTAEAGSTGLTTIWCGELDGVLQKTGSIDWEAETAAPKLLE